MAADSRTPECSAELVESLDAFRRDLGFAYDLGAKDGDVLMNSGTISKTYARDGTRYTIDFGLDTSGGGCSLLAYKFTESAPGETTITGAKGNVALDHCTCVAGD